MNNTVTMTMTREEAVRVLAMLAEPTTQLDIKNDFATVAQGGSNPTELRVVALGQQGPTETYKPAYFPTEEEIPVGAVTCRPDEQAVYKEDAQPTATTDSLVDDFGTPWDERIHSGGKSKMANGQWTRRRGVTPALYDTVMAQLTGSVAAPPAPPVVAAPPAPPAPPAPVEDSPFVALQKKVQAWIAAAVDGPQRSERAQALGKALKDYGVVSIPALASQPDLIPAIEMALAL